MRAGDLPVYLLPAAACAVGAVAAFVVSAGAHRLPRAMGLDGDDASPTVRAASALSMIGLALALSLLVLGSLPPDTPVSRVVSTFAIHLTLLTVVVMAARVDLAHMLLPDALTLGGAAFALATSPWRGVGLEGAAIGAVTGAAVGFGPAFLYRKLRGKSGLGLGDAKLLVLAGAWLGPVGALFVLFAGALQSALTAVSLHTLGVRIPVPKSVVAEIAEVRAAAEAGDEDARAALEIDPMAHEAGEGMVEGRLPLGPFLVLACVEYLFAGPRIASILLQ
jgi:leader peptidase (prepilin peptidase) / N-methyltransferase